MQAWENFLALQEVELGVEAVKRWLRPLRIVRFDAGNLYLEAKDPFHLLWFEEHVRPKLATQLLNNNGRRIRVHLSVVGKEQASVEKRKGGGKLEPPPPFSLQFDELDPTLTAARFIATEENQLAYSILGQIVVGDGLSALEGFNPLYLCGPSGSGKSHLLMAMAHGLKRAGVSCLYCRAETFTEHVVTAIRAGEMGTFRQAYRNVEVLLLDDVHLFAKKKATQEELFHTFNTLHTAGKQIVLSARSSPQELPQIEPRLISRFEWGLVVPLAPLRKDGLSALLTQRAQQLDFSLGGEVTDYLLQTFTSSAHALVRALDALVLRAHLSAGSGGLSGVAARELLKDLEAEEQKVAVTPERIVKVVADMFAIPTEEILGKSQQRDCVVPRQVAMYLCRERLGLSFAKIGVLFGRDHSTVISGIRQLERRREGGQEDLDAQLHVIGKKL